MQPESVFALAALAGVLLQFFIIRSAALSALRKHTKEQTKEES